MFGAHLFKKIPEQPNDSKFNMPVMWKLQFNYSCSEKATQSLNMAQLKTDRSTFNLTIETDKLGMKSIDNDNGEH